MSTNVSKWEPFAISQQLFDFEREYANVGSITHESLPQSDLCRSAMEEIGARATILELEGINGSERKYIDWLLGLCLKDGVQPFDVFTEAALDLMANQLTTPLQVNSYAWKALARGHQIGQKPVDAETL